MISKLHAEILTILRNNGNGMTTSQIVSASDSNKQSEIADISSTSKTIYVMRDADLITTWRDGTKNKHDITPKGYAELHDYEVYHGIAAPISTPEAPSADQTTTLQTAPGDQTDQIQTIHPETAPQPQPQHLEIVADDSHHVQPQTFDPFRDIYNQLQQAQEMLIKLPLAPTIANKDAKLEFLELLRNHHEELLNDKLADLLHDIIWDLKQLQAA